MITTFLSDLIFPHSCVGCWWFGTVLCKHCQQKIIFFPPHTPIATDMSHLDSVTAMAQYKGVLKSALHAFKFQSIQDVGIVLANILYDHTPFPRAKFITAIPLHNRRQRERGFNQAEVIAQELSRLSGIPYVQPLIRARYTTPQSLTQNKAERLNHLINAFQPTTNHHYNAPPSPGSSIILVDDVVTTGATLNECAIVLKHLGYTQVHGLAIAHGST